MPIVLQTNIAAKNACRECAARYVESMYTEAETVSERPGAHTMAGLYTGRIVSFKKS